MIYITPKAGYKIVLDDEFSFLLRKYKPQIIKPTRSNTFYCVLRERVTDNYVGLLHCLVMGHVGVDHINGNGLDCRTSNLRIADQSENQRNRRHTRSMHKGVYFRNDRKRYTSRITVRGNIIVLGSFDFYEDALAARLRAEQLYFGQFNGIGTQQLEG